MSGVAVLRSWASDPRAEAVTGVTHVVLALAFRRALTCSSPLLQSGHPGWTCRPPPASWRRLLGGVSHSRAVFVRCVDRRAQHARCPWQHRIGCVRLGLSTKSPSTLVWPVAWLAFTPSLSLCGPTSCCSCRCLPRSGPGWSRGCTPRTRRWAISLPRSRRAPRFVWSWSFYCSGMRNAGRCNLAPTRPRPTSSTSCDRDWSSPLRCASRARCVHAIAGAYLTERGVLAPALAPSGHAVERCPSRSSICTMTGDRSMNVRLYGTPSTTLSTATARIVTGRFGCPGRAAAMASRTETAIAIGNACGGEVPNISRSFAENASGARRMESVNERRLTCQTRNRRWSEETGAWVGGRMSAILIQLSRFRSLTGIGTGWAPPFKATRGMPRPAIWLCRRGTPSSSSSPLPCSRARSCWSRAHPVRPELLDRRPTPTITGRSSAKSGAGCGTRLAARMATGSAWSRLATCVGCSCGWRRLSRTSSTSHNHHR